MSINAVVISGNLARDAETRRTQGGMTILTFTVAVNDRRKDASGEWSDYTNWVNCSMFGKRAESLDGKLTKGTKVVCHGKLHYSSWEKDGQKRNKLDVTVNDLDFMSKAAKPEPEPVEAFVYDDNSEIPF